jgi:hypothetical protein
MPLPLGQAEMKMCLGVATFQKQAKACRDTLTLSQTEMNVYGLQSEYRIKILKGP